MSKDWFNDVLEFHKKFGCYVGKEPGDMNYPAMLREELVQEEYEEFRSTRRTIRRADAICDLIYVLIGTAISMGIDIRPMWDEVHRSNMAKEGGAIREDGKILKPEGWEPPDLMGEFKRQVRDAVRL